MLTGVDGGILGEGLLLPLGVASPTSDCHIHVDLSLISCR